MRRYLIFAGIGPAVGGFFLLLVTTFVSGYWTTTSAGEVAKLFAVAGSTLQYSYLFGILPTLILAAVDDILCHIRQINAVFRMLMSGAVGFLFAEFLYGSRGPDSGPLQFVLYGLVGLVPAMLCSWLAHRFATSLTTPVQPEGQNHAA